MRMTRAAARAEADIHEDETEVDATEVPLPQTPQRTREPVQQSPQRAPLGEITVNEKEEEPKIVLEVDLTKPAKKSKNKNSKGGRKPKNADDDKENKFTSESQGGEDKENTPEVLEDEVQSRPSSAASEACADLLKDTKEALNQVKVDLRPSTPPSRAVRVARKQLTPKSQTPRFDPEVHRAPRVVNQIGQKDDSFVESIQSRSPAKITAEPVAEDDMPITLPGPVSISPARSPHKSPRIEDSIEEIDIAAEALEKLGSIIEDDTIAPIESAKESAIEAPKARATTVASKTTVSKPGTTRTLAAKKSTPDLCKTGTVRRPTVRNPSPVKTVVSKPVTKPITPRLAASKPAPTVPRVAATKPAPGSKPTINKRKASAVTSTVSSKPPTKALTMPMRPKARVSSINKTPFVPQKSSKPPTQSRFTLPGEAVAARLREQREKRQGEAAAIPVSQPPVTKAATLGRGSRVSLANAKVGTGGTIRMPKTPRATVLPDKRIASNTSTDSMAVNVGGDTVKSVGSSSTLGRANTSAPRTSVLGSTVSRSTASTIKPRASTVFKTMPAQRSKPAPVSGQEVFARARNTLDAQAQAKKEKEEAAKKARADAAERGRQASREWAEKMKSRQAAAKTTKSAEAGA